MLTLSRSSRVREIAHRVFLSPPSMLLESRVAEQRDKEVRRKVPKTVEELSLCLVELVTLSSRFWYSYTSFSEALIEIFGEQVRPLIGPAVRHCIKVKVLDVWVYSTEIDSIRSETNPEFFLSLTDEALVEKLDSDLSLLSPASSRPPVKDLVIAFATLVLLVTVAALDVLQPWGSLGLGLVVFGLPLAKLVVSACRFNETRVRIALFFVDMLDLARFMFIGVPLLSLRWIAYRLYDLFRGERQSFG